jgi:hypothetical protein
LRQLIDRVIACLGSVAALGDTHAAAQTKSSQTQPWWQATEGRPPYEVGRLSRASKKNPELRDHGTRQFVAKRAAMVNGAARGCRVQEADEDARAGREMT